MDRNDAQFMSQHIPESAAGDMNMLLRSSIESEILATSARNSHLVQGHQKMQSTIEAAVNTAKNPKGPVAATGSLHGISRRNQLMDIDKNNRVIAKQLVKVKPIVSYTDQYFNGLK